MISTAASWSNMDALNSLLFILTTIAPSTTPPDSYPITYTPPSEWNTDVYTTEEFENAFIPPASDIPSRKKWDCPPNTHYETCGPACIKTCIEYDCEVSFCMGGCFCNNGYVRGTNGTCIRERECFSNSEIMESNLIKDSLTPYPKRCAPGEFVSCDSRCQRNCSNYQAHIRCPKTCKLGCVCLPPKIRGPNGSCILPQQCFSSPPTHMDKDMKDWTLMFHLLRIMNQEAPGCSLKAKQCDNPDDCSYDDDENDISVQIQVDDESKPCFPNLKPTGYRECPPGERYKECGDICFESCIGYDCPMKCCVEGCFCEEGYVRGTSGECIPKDQCPDELDISLPNQDKDSYAPAVTACRPYEIPSCYSQCQRNCSNYFHDYIPCPEVCVMGCICYPPMIRGPNGDCILPDQCYDHDPRLQRVLEEKLKKEAMIHNFHRIMESTQGWSDAPAVEEKRCHLPYGCSEKSEGNSPPSKQGQFWRCLKKNEYLNMCVPACPDICDNYRDQSQACKKICLPIPKCDCIAGFVRGPNGDCITPEECPNHTNRSEECSEFEYYDSCGTTCEDNCTTYMNPDKTCTDKSCKAGCFCKSGFIRGPDGRCILPVECSIRPAQPSDDHLHRLGSENSDCSANEEWLSCGTACPKDCTNYGKDISCIAMCREGCFCKKPRVRGPDGTCILIEECPLRSSGSDNSDCSENEEWLSCGTACPKDCTNYGKRNPCIAVCREGCFCKKPRVRGPDGTCILIEECPLRSSGSETCPENEEYKTCGTACPKDCTNYDIEINCIALCREGCFCQEPRVRGPDGTCILTEECPSRSTDFRSATGQFIPSLCKKNERFARCKNFCPDTCSNPNEGGDCRPACLPGCDCLPGYVRSRGGDCVRRETCGEEGESRFRRFG